MVWAVLNCAHAENIQLRKGLYCYSPFRLHYHGEGEKACHRSPKRRRAHRIAFFNVQCFLAAREQWVASFLVRSGRSRSPHTQVPG
jgi:hypothetical protein